MARPTRVGAPPSLDDFWEGGASWRLDVVDAGLPVGESDTLPGPDGLLWSYLHASGRSAGIVDSNGQRVRFPGCVTLWKSGDAGVHFELTEPVCLIPCPEERCDSVRDHVDQQQYPRVARHRNGQWVMVYEWRGWNFIRTSEDGVTWSAPAHVANTRQWNTSFARCRAVERVGEHPFLATGDDYQCSAGGPPGIYVEGETLYVLVALGKNPGSMGCYSGPLARGAAGLRQCATEWLFSGADWYGPLEARGAAGSAFFDFRMVSSADVVRVGDRYYMTYEGVRGPSGYGTGDDQFGLGLARSLGPWIDGPWEKYAGNPILGDLAADMGIGHADLLVLDGLTYLYTATSERTRGRYTLVWGE